MTAHIFPKILYSGLLTASISISAGFVCAETLPLPTLKMALAENKPPYLIVASRSGIEYELLEQIVREMGFRLEPEFVPANRAIYLFQNNQTEAIASLRSPPPGHGCATNPYITYRNVAISLASSQLDIQKVDDLARYRVAAFQSARLNLGTGYSAAVARSPYYVEVSPQVIANRLLHKRRVDVVIADPLIFRYLDNLDRADHVEGLENNRSEIVLHPIFPPSHYVAAFQNMEMCQRFNRALKAVQSSKLMQTLTDKYLLPADRPARAGMYPE